MSDKEYTLNNDDDTKIENDNSDETTGFKEYSITSYGVDYDVDGIVRRLQKDDIKIPEFQRQFVWEQTRASRFIESLLLGLPVPGIFLYKDESQKLLVIDGQQRLRTLNFFYEGVFGERRRIFKLIGLESRFKELTYETLEDEDRRRLDNSIIHATVIRQDLPVEDASSKYFVFERLNTGAKPLVPQEIRSAIYSGPFNNLLEKLNHDENWRALFGKINPRKRDEELILRFLALYFWSDTYTPPIKAFMNNYMSQNRTLTMQSEVEIRQLFTPTVQTIRNYIGEDAFKPRRNINAAVLDSVMIGVSRRLQKGSITHSIRGAYEKLLANQGFIDATGVATADTDTVKRRIKLATEAFDTI